MVRNSISLEVPSWSWSILVDPGSFRMFRRMINLLKHLRIGSDEVPLQELGVARRISVPSSASKVPWQVVPLLLRMVST